MNKFLSLVLTLILGLSINGIVFAQDAGASSDGNIPPCTKDDTANAGGVLISDFTGVLISDFTGVLISDFTGVLISDLYKSASSGSDGKDCRKE